MTWTDERLKIAAALWKDGCSAAVIAAKLGGISRNGVLGKMNRCRDLFPKRGGKYERRSGRVPKDIASEAMRPRKRVSARPPRSQKPNVEIAPAEPVEILSAILSPKPNGQRPFPHRGMVLDGGAPEGVPFVNLTRWQCGWPLVEFEDADGPDMPCCGRRRRGVDAPTSPYCAEHTAIARGEGR